MSIEKSEEPPHLPQGRLCSTVPSTSRGTKKSLMSLLNLPSTISSLDSEEHMSISDQERSPKLHRRALVKSSMSHLQTNSTSEDKHSPRRISTSGCNLKPSISFAFEGDTVKERSWWHFLHARYLPVAVIDRFCALGVPMASDPVLEKFDAAVAFIDISGFTQLSEKLAEEHGEHDASEVLNRYISGFFERLISAVSNHGGDIIKFAGDAMQVVWSNLRLKKLPPGIQHGRNALNRKKLHDLLGNEDEPLHTHVLKAAACLLSITEKMNNYEPNKSVSLSLHSGLAAGSLSALYVGGVDGLWEYFVAGPTVEGMGIASEQAKSGEVILTQDAFNLIEMWATGKTRTSDTVLLKELSDRPNPKPIQIPLVPATMEHVLNGFIPPIVHKRMDRANVTGVRASEYKFATIIFIKIMDLDYDKPGVLETVQKGVLIVQEVVLKFQGTILRLLADDKGTRFKIVFGMPGQVHEDDPVRAVVASLEISRRMRERGIFAVTGMATGPVFCGEAGSQVRCEYTAVGKHVNLAARISQAAEKLNKDILCCKHTHELALTQDVRFEECEPISMKGFSAPVSFYHPLGKIKSTQLAKSAKVLGIEIAQESMARRENFDLTRLPISKMLDRMRRRSLSGNNKKIVDREEELELVHSFLTRSIKDTVLVIEGDMGVGKKCLLAESLRNANELHIQALLGQVKLGDGAVPFGPWKSIFHQALGFEEVRSKKQREKTILGLLNAELTPMAALLNVVFDIELEETSFIKQMSVAGRNLNARKILLYLLIQISKSRQLCIVLEEFSTFDSASIKLAALVFNTVPHILGLVTMRTMREEDSIDISHFLHMHCVRIMQLKPLSNKGTLELACLALDVKSIPPSLENVFLTRSEGKPLHIEELARSVLHENILQVVNGEWVFVRGSEHIINKLVHSIPANIREWVASRIDRMEAAPHLTLQVLSVLGGEVKLDLLLEAHEHPHVTIDNLKNDIRILEKENFITTSDSTTTDDNMVVFFQSDIYKEVAYETMLKEQRKRIHKAAFEHLSRKLRETSTPENLYATLAMHANRAELWPRALRFNELAGRASLAFNAMEEAIVFFQTALELMEKVGVRDTERIEKGHLDLGDTYYKLGRSEQAIAEYRRALELVGHPVPTSARDTTLSFISNFTKQYLKRTNRVIRAFVRPRRSVFLTSQRESEVRLQLRRAYILEKMVQACFQAHHAHMAGYCAFKLAEVCEGLADMSQQHAMLTLSYAYCAYLSYPLHRRNLSGIMTNKAHELLNEGAYIPAKLRALIDLQLAMGTAASGEWGNAIIESKRVKAVFKELGERKKWREATLLAGVALHMHGYFDMCSHHLLRLLAIASADNDSFLQLVAQRWQAITELCQFGASESVSDHLQLALSMAEQLKQDELPVRITAEYNEFLRGGRLRDNVASFLEKARASLGRDNHLLWHAWPTYVHFTALALSACEQKHDSDDSTQKHLLTLATEGCRHLKQFAKSYPFAKCFSKMQMGRLSMLSHNEKKTKKRWSDAIKLGIYYKMPYFVGQSAFLMAEKFKCAPISYEKARDMLDRAGVNFHGYDQHEFSLNIPAWTKVSKFDGTLSSATQRAMYGRRSTRIMLQQKEPQSVEKLTLSKSDVISN